MAAQKPPFVSHDLKSLKRSIISGVCKRIPIHYSADLDAFIRLCLKVDAKERLTAHAMLDHELLMKRHQPIEEVNIEAASLNGSCSRKLLEKILAPRKR